MMLKMQAAADKNAKPGEKKTRYGLRASIQRGKGQDRCK